MQPPIHAHTLFPHCSPLPVRPQGPRCHSFLSSLWLLASSSSCLPAQEIFSRLVLPTPPTHPPPIHPPTPHPPPQAFALTFLFNLQAFLPLCLQTPFPCYLSKRKKNQRLSSFFPLGPTCRACLCPHHVCVPAMSVSPP